MSSDWRCVHPTMDFDTVSNCSGVSSRSDEIRSNASTLSGLSLYKDEFSELRHTINPLKYPQFDRCSTPKQDSGCESSYDNRVSDLSCQLENSLKLNEKYKNELYDLEKSIELKFHDRIQKLITTNLRLKIELDNANSQVQRLLSAFSTERNTSLVPNATFIQLEQKYYKLSLESATLQLNLQESRNQNEEYERENKDLNIELNQLKTDCGAKKLCIKELKKKIIEQTLKIQSSLKDNALSTQTLHDLSSELEHLKKIQDWYKEQLQVYQNNKKSLTDEILNCKINLASKDEIIESLNLDVIEWKEKYNDSEFKMLKEKDRFFKQTQSDSFSGDCEYSLPELNTKNSPNCSCLENDRSVINYYEDTIQDLTSEIKSIKEYIQEQDKKVKDVGKENSDLIAQCVTLQKVVRQNEIMIEELENAKKCLSMELNLANEKLRENSTELSSVRSEVFRLNGEAEIREEEKKLVDSTIKNIREHFDVFRIKYENLEEKLQQKNKQILQLQTEKQKLFMDNNWNICELEKISEKDGVISNLSKEVSTLVIQMKSLKKGLIEKESAIEHLTEEKQGMENKNREEIKKYEAVFTQYKDMVTDYENQIYKLQEHLGVSETTIIDLQDNIKILKDELSKRDSDLNKMTINLSNLQSTLISYEKGSTGNVKDENCSKETSHKNNDKSLVEAIYQFLKNCETATKKCNGLNTKEYIDINKLFNIIEKHVRQDNNIDCNILYDRELINQFTAALHALMDEIQTKLVKVDDAIKIMNKKVEKCSTLLNTRLNLKEKEHENEKIKELNILLQVKELQIKEKQKKYEVNYRTLLKKVKEHMRGRNSAEKHNKYLQELYNSLSDEKNSLKLSITSKDYKNINEKLNYSVLTLEEEALKNQTCDRCFDYAVTVKKLAGLEAEVKRLEEEKGFCSEYTNKKGRTQELKLGNSNLNSEKEKYLSRIEELLSEKKNLANQIDNEIKIVSSTLQGKTEELGKLEMKKNHNVKSVG
ncbi:hypothetical protein NQ317_002921 [Molorchus minor]|uniref:Uncharacterized protein n=1 Tax=Molorchus minor TaxID=1323400 RepID=A0ABQ9J6U1_9CUCU|nr:hypothetical protein NQ317_002921 [Molorchus minor]